MNNHSLENNVQPSRTKFEVQTWLVNQVAELLNLDPKKIDTQAPFNSFGLSSRDAIMLSGDLEDWLSCRLSPTIIYEYPSIDALSRHLSDDPGFTGNQIDLSSSQDFQQPASDLPFKTESGTQPPDRLSSSEAEDEFQNRLSELEQLSDEDAEAQLLEKLNKINIE